MKLTQASSYALHALAHLAAAAENITVASHVAAEACGIPENFLLKVLKPLVSARLLHSLKGPNGAIGSRDRPPRSPCWKSSRPSTARSAAWRRRSRRPTLMSSSKVQLTAIGDQAADTLRKTLQKVRLAAGPKD